MTEIDIVHDRKLHIVPASIRSTGPVIANDNVAPVSKLWLVETPQK